LKYHPDKNTLRSESEQKESERLFKELQTAYERIGSPDSRREFDNSQRFLNGAASSPSSSAAFSQFSQQTPQDAFAQAFRSTRSYTKPYPSFRFYSSNSVFGQPAERGGFPLGNLGSLKSIYEQRVRVPLEDLYNGTPEMNFTLRENLWTRYRAAFRGGIGYVILYQSFLYTLPILRITNRWVALALSMILFHQQVPVAFQTDAGTFRAPIQAGYKEGTKFTFQSPSDPRIEFEFVLSEEKHPIYYRDGNDLHASVTISHREAKEGCKVEIESLDKDTSCIEVEVPAGLIQKSGESLTVQNQGWPNRKSGRKGDLIVHFKLVATSRKEQRKR
jgi:DnaJ-class molecular chaperone